VDLVKDKATEELYALKKISFQTTEQREKALQEAKLLKDCDHPNVGEPSSSFPPSLLLQINRKVFVCSSCCFILPRRRVVQF
jgi:serine/threonine protein kinase